MAIAYRRHRVTMGNLLEEAQENNIVIPVPESAKHQQGD
jgi:glutamine phosphoribosylpyrophosphate amidotransferase